MTDATRATLCIAVKSAQASTERGQSAGWTVAAWSTGGDLADVTLRLRAAPADGGAPGFSFGCGSDDGTSTCDLGTVDAASAPRQLQAQVTVPVDASAVTSVRLTVTGNAPDLVKAASAAAAVSITAASGTAIPTGQAPTTQPAVEPSVPAASSSPALPSTVPTSTTPLPVGNLPGITLPIPSTTLSPGGSAADLFPTLDPSRAASGSARAKTSTRATANTSALPEGASIADAQIAGLSALALAFVLAVTRLSVRRRPATPPGDHPGEDQPADANPAAEE